MAHDLKGNKLKPGAKVNVPCRIEVIDGESVTLRTSHVAPGEIEGTELKLHSAQTKKSAAKG
jgi:hypothetical protein